MSLVLALIKEKAERRLHIVEGLIRVISILDEVIALIRASDNKADAKENLKVSYDFTEEQAEAIVTLQLYRLTNTDIVTLEEEHASLKEQNRDFGSHHWGRTDYV